jgi:hypothetical protein
LNFYTSTFQKSRANIPFPPLIKVEPKASKEKGVAKKESDLAPLLLFKKVEQNP